MSVVLSAVDVFKVIVEFFRGVGNFLEMLDGEERSAFLAGVVFGEGDGGLESITDLSAEGFGKFFRVEESKKTK